MIVLINEISFGKSITWIQNMSIQMPLNHTQHNELQINFKGCIFS